MPKTDEMYWIDLPSHADERGRLTAIEAGTDIPIEVQRVFYVHATTQDRGGHAHRYTDQVLIAVHGSLTVRAFDGATKREFRLDDATRALFVPRMLFIELLDISRDGVCLALTNSHYDRAASFRTRAEYLAALAGPEAH